MTDGITAEEMGRGLKEISIAEFFEKNRHLLGFDNPQKALITVVKEAVDNSLDACEEARILPNVKVTLKELGNNLLRVTIEDNGPGILKTHIPNVFGKLLYGSKFHRLRQSRGQQGIGISAAVLYSQLTTGKPIHVISRISESGPAHRYKLRIDTLKNVPEILEDEILENARIKKGTIIEMDIEGKYIRSKHSPLEYLSQCAIMNPFAKINFKEPDGTRTIYERVISELPKPPAEIKPHPRGIELGILIRMLKMTKARNIKSFLTSDFSRVGSTSAADICKKAKVDPKTRPSEITRDDADRLLRAMQKTKLMAPPTNCLSPVGEDAILAGLKKEINAEFYASISRTPAVYRGYPFQIEAGVAYGGEIPSEGPAKIIRFANRVPLLYELGACAITQAVSDVNWKRYGLDQTGGRGVPRGPLSIIVHMVSVWVPFTSESKEAIASYEDIMDEIKLAVQECGRHLGRYLSGKRRAQERETKKKSIEKYAPEIAAALSELTGEKPDNITKMINELATRKFHIVNKELMEDEEPQDKQGDGSKPTKDTKPGDGSKPEAKPTKDTNQEEGSKPEANQAKDASKGSEEE